MILRALQVSASFTGLWRKSVKATRLSVESLANISWHQDLRKLLQRQLDKGKIPDIVECVKQASSSLEFQKASRPLCLRCLRQASCLSQGMKYQFATGNWGQDGMLPKQDSAAIPSIARSQQGQAREARRSLESFSWSCHGLLEWPWQLRARCERVFLRD